MQIKSKTVWITSDGGEYDSREFAEGRERTDAIEKLLGCDYAVARQVYLQWQELSDLMKTEVRHA